MTLEDRKPNTREEINRINAALDDIQYNSKTIRQLEKLLAYYRSKKNNAHNMMHEVNTSDKWKERSEEQKITRIAVNSEIRIYGCIIEDLEDLLKKTKETYDECFNQFDDIWEK